MPNTLNTPNQRLARDLDLQISAVSVNLQGSMLPIVEVLIGSSSHRPIALARRLKIDKTLTTPPLHTACGSFCRRPRRPA